MRSKTRKNSLEEYRSQIARCVKCGSCSTVCPSFLADRRESRSPRGRIALIEAVLDGRLEASQVYRDRLATCTGCLACEARCSNGVPVTAIIHAAKEDAVQGAGPGLIAGAIAAALKQPFIMRSLAWLAPVALHYQGDTMRGTVARGQGYRSAKAGTGGGRRAAGKRIIFFPGCAIRYFQRDIEEASVAVLERLGYEVIVPEGLRCCGRPFLSLGDRNAAQELAEGNAALLRSLSGETIVTACASCGLTFKRDYPALLASAGAGKLPVMDIHEFLADKMDRLALDPLPLRCTVHDPCHLGRGQGLAGAVRTVLDAVPGLDRVEMREPDRCCGFGGVMRATHPSLSTAIGSAKAKDIAATGAPVVVTGCPSCRMQITDALRHRRTDAEVMHTVQVIAAAVRNAECGVRKKERKTPANHTIEGGRQ